jgi:hypothetical protein
VSLRGKYKAAHRVEMRRNGVRVDFIRVDFIPWYGWYDRSAEAAVPKISISYPNTAAS